MERIRQLRESCNFTQKQLAEMMQTTQQTVGRWESGKAEPSLTALRDLAVIFATSTDDLLGTNPLSRQITTSLPLIYDMGESSGFWGHVGILLYGQENTHWYPITLSEANRIGTALSNADSDQTWINLTTLNNRCLAINLPKIRRIWLLDDACDQPNDWVINHNEYSGLPLEVYRGLDDYFSCDEEWESNTSEAYRQTIKDVVDDLKLNEDKAYKYLHDTNLYLADGEYISYWFEGSDLWGFIESIDMEFWSSMVRFTDLSGREIYFPIISLSMVDMPLIDIMDAAKVDHESIDFDED